MGIWAEDYFDESSDIGINSHALNTGQAWVSEPSWTTNQVNEATVKANVGYAVSFSGGDDFIHRLAIQPQVLDYDIEATFWTDNVGAGSNSVMLYFRGSIAGSNPAYRVQLSGGQFSHTLQMVFGQNGTFATSLGLVDVGADWSPNTQHTLKVEVRGSNFKIYLDGDLKLNIDDSTLPGTGGNNYVGFMLRTTSSGSGTNRIYRFAVDDLNTDPCAAPEPLDFPMYDEFAGPNNTPLSSHTADTGHAWIEGHGNPPLSARRRGFGSFSTPQLYPMVLNGQGALVNPQAWRLRDSRQLVYAPRTNSYEIGACFQRQDISMPYNSLSFFWRDTSREYLDGAGKRYELHLLKGGDMVLQKRIGKTATVLDSDTEVFADGENNYLQIIQDGNDISIKLNGSEVLSATDASILEPGTISLSINGRSLTGPYPKGFWRLNWFYVDDSYESFPVANKAVVLTERLRGLESLVKEDLDFDTAHFVNITDTLTAVDAMEPPDVEEPTTKDVEIIDGLTLNDLLALTQEQTCEGSPIVTEAGSFNKATSTGNQVINHGLGVTPKAIIIWMAGDISTARNFLFGFSDGVDDASVNGMEVHNSANSNAQRRLANDSIVSMINSSGTVIWAATLSAWDDSTFTLNWGTNDSNALEFHYLLIGGDNVLAKVLEWGTGTSGGNLGVTGVGFQPDALIHIHQGFAAGTLPAGNTAFNPCIGMVDAAGNNRAISLCVRNGQATMDTQRGQVDKVLYRISTSSGALDWSALHVSMDSDGFTINNDNPPGASNAILTLCLKGVSCKVGVLGKSTNTSVPVAQQIASVGFTPKAAIFMSVMAAASASVQDHARIAIGASDGTNEGCASWKSEDNSANADVDTITSNTKAIQISNNDTTSIEAEADVSSFAPDEINLSWTTNNNVATEIVYMAFGDSPGASCDMVLISILDTLTANDAPEVLGDKGIAILDFARINELPGVSGNHVNKRLTIADSLSAEDTPSPSRELAVSDSFTASEFVGRVFDFLDILSAQETLSIQALIEVADTASIEDAVALRIIIALADSMTLTDVLSRYAEIKDTAGLLDLINLLRSTNPQADFARARDSITVIKTGAAEFAPPERTFYARDLKRLKVVEKGKHIIR